MNATDHSGNPFSNVANFSDLQKFKHFSLSVANLQQLSFFGKPHRAVLRQSNSLVGDAHAQQAARQWKRRQRAKLCGDETQNFIAGMSYRRKSYNLALPPCLQYACVLHLPQEQNPSSEFSYPCIMPTPMRVHPITKQRLTQIHMQIPNGLHSTSNMRYVSIGLSGSCILIPHYLNFIMARSHHHFFSCESTSPFL